MLVVGKFIVGHADIFREAENTLIHSEAIAVHAETFDSHDVPLSVNLEDRQDVQKEKVVVRGVEAHVAMGVVDGDWPFVVSRFFGSVEIREGGHLVSRWEIVVAASGSRILLEVFFINQRTMLIDFVGVEPFPAMTDDFVFD